MPKYVARALHKFKQTLQKFHTDKKSRIFSAQTRWTKIWSEGSICITHQWCTHIRFCRHQFNTKNCRHIFILWDRFWQHYFSRPQHHCLWTIFHHIQYGEENHPTPQLPRNKPRCNHMVQTKWYGLMGPQWCLLLVLPKGTKQIRGHAFLSDKPPSPNNPANFEPT